MANDLLPGANDERYGRQQKGTSLTASASLNLSTSLQDIITYGTGTGAWLPVGNAPCLSFSLKWTFSGGTILTIMPWLTNDIDLTIVHPGYVIRDQGAVATDGYITGYPAGVKLPKGAISSATGFWDGSSSTLYAPLVVDTTGYRWCKLQAKSDNASGSVIAYTAVGTNG